MAEGKVTIGDYTYERNMFTAVYGGAGAKVVDSSKSVYSDPLSIVTIGGDTYDVTVFNRCFQNCDLLVTAPRIPDTARIISYCFDGCSSLTQAPTIPSGVTNMRYCFNDCSSLTQAPTIPSNVTDMQGCFRGCSSLTQAPTIPSGVTHMGSCFSKCSSLTQAPTIPSNVTDMNECFRECNSLAGNIVVYNSPQLYNYVFLDTPSDIFIINIGSGETVWKTIASTYQNVHYEADDNSVPAISGLNATRVASSGATTFEPTGLYAYIQARVMVYDNLIPDGWTNELKGTILKDNGTTETVTWQPPITGYPADIYCWIYLGDTSTHSISLQISDSIKEDGVEKRSSSSVIQNTTVSKSYALVDYYHDPDASGVTEGMSIGKYAEHADLLDVDMPTTFRQNVEVEDELLAKDLKLYIDTSAQSGVDKEIYDALGLLGWTDVIE